jgi:hypothetical protein
MYIPHDLAGSNQQHQVHYARRCTGKLASKNAYTNIGIGGSATRVFIFDNEHGVDGQGHPVVDEEMKTASHREWR